MHVPQRSSSAPVHAPPPGRGGALYDQKVSMDVETMVWQAYEDLRAAGAISGAPMTREQWEAYEATVQTALVITTLDQLRDEGGYEAELPFPP